MYWQQKGKSEPQNDHPIPRETSYTNAFNTYAELCDDFITQAKNGNPYDTSSLRAKQPLAIKWIFISIGKFLESVGYTYSPEVKYHGNPDVQNPTKELTLLNWADTHVDGEGNRASFEERLQDIGKRHGTDSIAYKNCQRLIDSFSE